MIKNNNIITQQELSKQLNLSLPTIKKNIKILKDLGILSRQGSNRNGYWNILNNIDDTLAVNEMFEDLDK